MHTESVEELLESVAADALIDLDRLLSYLEHKMGVEVHDRCTLLSKWCMPT